MEVAIQGCMGAARHKRLKMQAAKPMPLVHVNGSCETQETEDASSKKNHANGTCGRELQDTCIIREKRMEGMSVARTLEHEFP